MAQHPEKSDKPLRRRRCDNCFGIFQPTKKWARFCKDQCRKEFHQHGSAFGPLKTRLEKLTVATVKECVKSIEARLTVIEKALLENREPR